MLEQAVVDHDRLGEEVAAVHDPVTHRREGVAVDRRPVAVEGAEGRAQRVLEVLDATLLGVVLAADRVREPPAVLADPLDRPGRLGDAGAAVEEAVLQGRRPRVEDQHPVRHDRSWAWIAVIATVLTMSRTNAPRERSLTGLRRPCSTGPTASAPAERCTAL